MYPFSASHLPPSLVSVTYTIDLMLVFLSPAVAEQATVADEERRAGPSPIESAALAATRARRTRRREYHLPNAVDGH